MSPQNNSFTLPPAPVQQLHSALFDSAAVQVWVQREDLIDAELGGNKWHKLKYNLQAARQQNHHRLLTFGGAYSNHIYATAAAGKRFGFDTIGVIRGEAHLPLNSTLQFATDCGMHLHYLDRNSYRNKHSDEIVRALHHSFGEFYLIPEGGSNALAVQGCREMLLAVEHDFDIICCACGTGATLAGISLALQPHQQAIGYAALKGGEFLEPVVKQLRDTAKATNNSQWRVETAYHFGGYAKTTESLFEFMRGFEHQHGFALDAVYTAKMFYGIFENIKQGRLPRGSRILALHSGGLQGNASLKPAHKTTL